MGYAEAESAECFRYVATYLENCTNARELDAVAGEVFGWVKSTSRGSGKATNTIHQRVACVEMDQSNTVFVRRCKSTVIGCFWRDFVSMTGLRPFLVRATGKLFKTSHAKL